jgi:hypothetical protein
MALREIVVRPDWRAVETQVRARRVRWRTELLLGPIAYGLVTLALAALRLPWGWLVLSQWLMFGVAFLALPVRIALADQADSLRARVLLYVVILSSSVLAFFSTPGALRGPGWSGIPALPPWTAVLIPIAMIAALEWANIRHGGLLRSFGLSGPRWAYQAAIGCAAGLALGFHLLSIDHALPYAVNLSALRGGVWIWVLATTLGVSGLGQELTLRGLLYRLLLQDWPGRAMGVWFRIVLLTVVMYLAPLVQGGAVMVWPYGLIYGPLFGVIALALRHDLRSAIAPYAASVVFGLFVVMVMLP